MKIIALSTLAIVLALSKSSSGANCYGPGNAGASVSQYQTVASVICNGEGYYGRNYNCQSSCCVLVEAWFSGTGGQRSQCWNAYNNIISQCVQGSGRNGGEWLWNSNGVTQNYFIQSNWVCGLSATQISGANNIGVNGTTQEA